MDASRFWFNYRHAANTLAIYKTIKRLGIPDENIILMVADDYACNSRNVRAGEVFTDDSGYENNVYTEDIEVDYRGDEVTPANVLRVLLDAHYYNSEEDESDDDDGSVLLNLPNSKRTLTVIVWRTRSVTPRRLSISPVDWRSYSTKLKN